MTKFYGMIIRKPSELDRDDILEVMKHWNMHHVPSKEMEELNISCFFVATIDNIIIGASGYKILTCFVVKIKMCFRNSLYGTKFFNKVVDFIFIF